MLPLAHLAAAFLINACQQITAAQDAEHRRYPWSSCLYEYVLWLKISARRVHRKHILFSFNRTVVVDHCSECVVSGISKRMIYWVSNCI